MIFRRWFSATLVVLVVFLNLGLVTSTIGRVHTPSRSSDPLTMRSLVERQLVTWERAVYVELRELAPESAYLIAEDAAAFRSGRARLWLSGIARANSWQFVAPAGECELSGESSPLRAGLGRFFDWELHLRDDGLPAEIHVVHGSTDGRDPEDRPFLLVVDSTLLEGLSCTGPTS